MPERLTPISKARANLPRLSQTAQKRLDRYIITLQGQPQSVLIGYDEYRGMKAAVELMQRPDIVEDIKAGLKELDEGKGVPLSEMKARVHEARRARETSMLAAELAAESGVDSQVVENIIGRFGEKMMTHISGNGSAFLPGVGEVTAKQVSAAPPGKTDATAQILSPRPKRYIVIKKVRFRGGKRLPGMQEVLMPEPEKDS